MVKILPFIKLLRPAQWLKNILLFLPLIFSGNLDNWPLLTQNIIAFAIFSLTASGVYVFNDICDITNDQLHPQKKLRPLASGIISLFSGQVTYLAIWSASIILSKILLPNLFTTCLLFYIFMNILYSKWLKKITYLDILLIAAMYPLRLIAGAVATQVNPSIWVIGISSLVALGIIANKRFSEIKNIPIGASTKKQHNQKYLIIIMKTTYVATLILYFAYSFKHSPLFLLTNLPAAYVIQSYFDVTLYQTKLENPVEIILAHKKLSIAIVSWFVIAILTL